MPTVLAKQVIRKLDREDLVVRITPEGLYTREPRRRTWWGPVPWKALHWNCQKIQIDAIVNERLAKRKGRRRVKRGKV